MQAVGRLFAAVSGARDGNKNATLLRIMGRRRDSRVFLKTGANDGLSEISGRVSSSSDYGTSGLYGGGLESGRATSVRGIRRCNQIRAILYSIRAG